MSTSAERFIEQLSKREMLSEAIIKRLWDKVANSSSVPSAMALATFLVDKGHLTREQADEALSASRPKREKRAPKPKADKPVAKKRSSSRDKSRSSDPFEETGAGGGEKSTEKKRSGKKKGYKKKTKGDNEFDTPLILLGGGGLVLGVLACVGLLWLLFSESGDERLAAARTAFQAGSYSQAIQDYEKFLDEFSSHEGRSEARVTLGIARIRQLPEGNPEARLKKAQTEISAIEDEDEFPSVQEDLASLLPGIAKGLAEQADQATELEEIRNYVGLTREALVLTSNTKYLPTRLRDEQELGLIEEVLARIALRQVALEDLEKTLAEMNKAVADGDTRTAYASHFAFVKAHPEKAGDPELVEAVAATSQAEKEGIRFVDEKIASLKNEAKSAVTAEVAMADRRRTAEAPASGVTVVNFQGGAYAFDRRDGRLRWRRALGASLQETEPALVGDDCLLVDSAKKELVRVNAATGKLVWRTPLDDKMTQPVLLGGRVLVAGASGKLHVVDAASGDQVGCVQFAQSLRSPPAVFEQAGRVFMVGDHSSVYTLDARDLSCLGVYYLGHAAGTVVSPPAVVLNRVVVVENDGAATSRLHLFGLDEQGVVAKELKPEDESVTRLTGLMTRPPEVFGKRFAVTTESGYIGVYEASSEEDAAAVTRLATRATRRQARSTPYTAVADQQLWVASAGMARYSIQPVGNRLPEAGIEETFRGDTFVHPLRVVDGVVIHVRRRRGRAGATVAASDLKSGALYWETDIAVPAAGPPVSAANGNQLLYTVASGKVFVIDQQAVESGVADRSASPPGAVSDSLLDAGAGAPQSGVYASSASGAAIGVVASGDASIQPFQLPGALAGAPVRFAEGWVAPLAVGQLLYFDGRTGAPLAAPFQPELAPRETIAWREPEVAMIDNRPHAFVTDGTKRVYSLALLGSPAPHLAPMGQQTLKDAEYASRVGVSPDHVAIATNDLRLLYYSAQGLEPAGESPLPSVVVWGPYAAGGKFLLATADGGLHAFDPASPEQRQWSSEVDATQLSSAPQVTGQSVLLTLGGGEIQARSLADGSLASTTAIGQAIATSPVVQGNQFLVAAHDGALLFVDPSQGE